MESLDLLANNVANASTGGYKADREFYSLYVAPEAARVIRFRLCRHRAALGRSFAGSVHTTGNPLDVASRQGLFRRERPRVLCTRNGSFRLAADGRLTTTMAMQFAIQRRATHTAGCTPHRNRAEACALSREVVLARTYTPDSVVNYFERRSPIREPCHPRRFRWACACSVSGTPFGSRTA